VKDCNTQYIAWGLGVHGLQDEPEHEPQLVRPLKVPVDRREGV
jgi:hypothetical protein